MLNYFVHYGLETHMWSKTEENEDDCGGYSWLPMGLNLQLTKAQAVQYACEGFFLTV